MTIWRCPTRTLHCLVHLQLMNLLHPVMIRLWTVTVREFVYLFDYNKSGFSVREWRGVFFALTTLEGYRNICKRGKITYYRIWSGLPPSYDELYGQFQSVDSPSAFAKFIGFAFEALSRTGNCRMASLQRQMVFLFSGSDSNLCTPQYRPYRHDYHRRYEWE